MLKVGATDLLLRMIEAGVPMRDMALENPIRAIREISHDITGMHPVTLANGRTVTAVDLQEEYLARVHATSSPRAVELDARRSSRCSTCGSAGCARCAPATCRSSTASWTG